LAGFREAGVNRLSIGVQSLDDATLQALSRRHTADEAREAVRAARAAGFDKLSLDFMLGLSGMTTATWRRTLEAAVALDPEHMSCYILTVDERVPMGRDVARGRLVLPDDDDIAAQYELTRGVLAAAGFEHYEISNWAKPGRQSRHNLTYWRDEPYLGIGAGAAGWVDGVRTKNTPSPRRYMASVAAGSVERVEEERPDLATRLGDALAVGLRLREGIDLGALGQRHGVDVHAILGETLVELTRVGCFEERAGRLRVAEGSVMVTSELLVRLEGAIMDWAATRAVTATVGPPDGSVVADAQPPAEIDEGLLAAGR
jgi:oxygen-independent coproporphyrinogen-3 oxidase